MKRERLELGGSRQDRKRHEIIQLVLGKDGRAQEMQRLLLLRNNSHFIHVSIWHQWHLPTQNH